ncbi:rubredoxin [Microbacterium trichothecenolyticum]|uniref:GmrSD restriction endonuclease domain-containing protein n=1 Tax=Microbacterium trichothecenolyticum TaxID=69370 RepID=UPI00285E3F0C|nr:DUF262 domain-containing protein [Microbacterium trichothecenolyticum]MDR7187155.1 rubredoxin [Microbacterium trichothecenolyticum]
MTNSEPVVNLYDCDSCGYRYDPQDHAGVDFDEQPEAFECPTCQAGRDHFHVFTPPTDDVAPEPKEEGPAESRDPLGPRLMYTKASSPTLHSLYNRYTKGRLVPQPEFQRYEVWSVQKRSALIESVLLDLPVPQVFLAQEGDGASVVVDGQQRLMAIFRFFGNEYALKGVGKSIEGKKFKDLPATLQEKIENYELNVVEVLKESDPDIRFALFQRLNEGSVSLNDQELRNCVMRGPYNEFIKELSAEPAWRKRLKLKARHPRMVDVELVLRYMAFRDQTYLKHPDKKTSKFLDRQMSIGDQMSEKELADAKRDFRNAVELAETVFGENAFRRFVAGDVVNPGGAWDKRQNRALMDVQLWGFNRYEKGVYVKNADAIREATIELLCTSEFSDLLAHTISESKRIERRFDLWKNMLDEVLKGSEQGPRAFSRDEKEAAFSVNPVCAICNQKIQSIDDAHLDHVEPFSKGGKTESANAALTHRYCNQAKSNS